MGPLSRRVLERVAAHIAEQRLLAPGEPALALVSGGADSTLLACVLSELGHPLELLHVAHALRGAESEQDARACEALAAALGATCRRVDAAVPAGPNLEARARELRRRAALAAAGGRWIATGHTADDRVETLLYRLASSRGRRALHVLPPRAGLFVRPLLVLGRKEVRAALREAAVSWREDASNDDRRFARNRIRLDVLPAFEAIHPAARANLLATAEELLEESTALDAAAAGLLDGRGQALDVRRAAAAPHALARHALRLLAGPPSPPRAGLERALGLLASTAGSAWVPLDRERRAERRYGELVVVPLQPAGAPAPTPLAVPGATAFGPFLVEAGEPAEAPGLDPRLAGSLHVRAARAGERAPGRSRTVRRLLLEARVPASLRHCYPVVESAGELVCVPGLALAPAYTRERGLAITARRTR